MRFLLALALFAAACAPAADVPAPETAAVPEGYEAFGDVAFTANGALPVEAVVTDPEAYLGQTVTLEGTVHEVCQMAGCWLTFDGGTAGAVRIRVPRGEDGYAFTVPTDISGRHAVVRGTIEAGELSPEMQEHLAEDAGETAPTAAEAKQELQMTASGVLVRTT